MDTAEKAVMFKHQGRNCCQAVTAALSPLAGLAEGETDAASAGFCAGMGNMDATCGALIGAVMIAGIKTEGKRTLGYARKISENFKERCGGALRCADLKGADTGKVLCPCDDCVRNAVNAYCDVMIG
ncbi:MAG: C_GCAxxG_C_C family protein [Oscillospiraceae bacterium]|nr:C_GCAxxG_C_C family protein [Oscillospiraceae bacterium]